MGFTRCSRFKNPMEIFNTDEIKKIHEASMKILKNIGIKVLDEKSLDFLSKNGAEVDFENKIVKLDRDLVNSCIKKVPTSFSYYTQDYQEMRIGEGDFYTVSMVEESYFLDSETSTRRESSSKDLVDCIRLLDQLPYYHIICNPVLPHDIDPKLAIIYSAAQIYKNTSKNCLVVPSNAREAQFLIELGAVIAGSENKLTEKPVLSVSIAPSSPLKLPENICGVIWEYALRKLPIIIVQAPMAGATAPVTIAGTMAQANAESLATLTLIQLIREGTPIVYGGAVMMFDLKTGFPAYGSIEWGLLSILTAQLGRFYGLPIYGSGGATNANINDAQSGYEKMSSTLLSYLAGHDMMCDAGLNANGLISFDSIITQNEIFAKTIHLSKDIEISDETLAIDTIRNVMAGSDYLYEDHTLKNIHRDFLYSNAGNRKAYDQWKQDGGLDSISEGNKLAKELIASYSQHKLSEEKNHKIDKILKRAKEEILNIY
jgi:trimethylamine--corrinoid protein Co-methyltransferase